MNPAIAQVVVGLPVEGPFDYSIPENLKEQIAVGQRVRVSFARRISIGYIVGFKEKSSFPKLNPILSLLDSAPTLDQRALQLTKQLSEYYSCSWGEAIEAYLPTPLRKVKEFNFSLPLKASSLSTSSKEITLLHDVSLDKRWPFLIEQIKKRLTNKESVLFLIPEISLAGAIESKLKTSIDAAMIISERPTNDKKDLEHWCKVQDGNAYLCLGTRSAVFTPLSKLGLIIIYDEENGSYKQEQIPHYHVHQVAFMRQELEGCEIIFVSAAPCAETWGEAKKEKWTRVDFSNDQPAAVQMVDMTNYNPQKTSILSFPLQNSIQKILENRGRIILFMNRRGFSTLTRCNQCGFTVKCQRCDVNLTYLYSKKMMVCRHCNFTQELPKLCPSCHGSYLRSMGTGMEKLESELARLYPYAKVSLYDQDTTQFPQMSNIIIATQAILREKENIRADLVAMMNFDAELNRLDFRSAQKAFSLLVHLRLLAKEKFVIQTRMIDSYCFPAISKFDFNLFYNKELVFRKELQLPPYKHLVAINLRGAKEDVVFEQSKILYQSLTAQTPSAIEVSDLHPDILPKLRDKYRYSIMLKGKSVKGILAFAKKVLKDFKRRGKVILTINVDP